MRQTSQFLSSNAVELKQRMFLDDVVKGIFTIMPVPASRLYPKAIKLAERHSARLGTRSLDLMHVAAALLLNAETFLSFDERQRKAAKVEGLKVLPREMPKE